MQKEWDVRNGRRLEIQFTIDIGKSKNASYIPTSLINIQQIPVEPDSHSNTIRHLTLQ